MRRGSVYTYRMAWFAALAVTVGCSVGNNLVIEESSTGNGEASPTISLSTHTFSTLSLGSADPTQEITITNDGVGRATSVSFSFSYDGAWANPFSISAKTCTDIIESGASCTLTITYSPSAPVEYTANLVFSYDSLNSSFSSTIELKGAATGGSDLDLSFSDDGEVKQKFADRYHDVGNTYQTADGKIIVWGGVDNRSRWQIEAVADTAGSLDGKYFILGDQDDNGTNTVAFWIDVDDSGTAEPVHGATRSVEITTIATGNSATDVAGAVSGAVGGDTEFNAYSDGSDVFVDAKFGGLRAGPNAGDSGFTITELITGAINQKFYLAKYNSDGSLDTSFGQGGARLINIDMNSDGDFDDITAAKKGLKVLSDGSMVLGTFICDGVAGCYLLVAKFTDDAVLDTSFNPTGSTPGTLILQPTDLDANFDKISGNALAVQDDGKFVVAGHIRSTITTQYHILLLRVNTDGTLDTTFGGGDGWIADDITGPVYESGRGIEIVSDGILVLSFFVQGDWDNAVAKYLLDGSAVDTSFGGGDGIANVDASQIGQNELTNRMLVQPDGKIIIAGSTFLEDSNVDMTPDAWDMSVVRLNSDGTLDTTFGGGDGIWTENLSGTTIAPNDRITDVELMPDGKIMFVGWIDNNTNDYIMGRLTSSGSLDTTFYTNGYFTENSGGDDIFTSISRGIDDRLLVTGKSGPRDTGITELVIRRYFP